MISDEQIYKLIGLCTKMAEKQLAMKADIERLSTELDELRRRLAKQR